MDGFVIRYKELTGKKGITFFANPVSSSGIDLSNFELSAIVMDFFYNSYPTRIILSLDRCSLDEYKRIASL